MLTALVRCKFFAFYRSMEAYRKSMGSGTSMVLSPDSLFPVLQGQERRPEELGQGQNSSHLCLFWSWSHSLIKADGGDAPAPIRF